MSKPFRAVDTDWPNVIEFFRRAGFTLRQIAIPEDRQSELHSAAWAVSGRRETIHVFADPYHRHVLIDCEEFRG